MDNQYWIGRWQRNDIGWHQKEAEPALVAHFSNLKPTCVFVPLCGKSLDLKLLASQGHQVIGVELSTLAAEAFFVENKIECQKSTEGEFTVYRGGGVTIFNGDFFEFGPVQLERLSHSGRLNKIGAVYDRAALIALPAEIRARYAAHMIALLNKCGGEGMGSDDQKATRIFFLQLVIERIPHDESGPPFSVPFEELKQLYGKYFELKLLNRESFELGESDNTKAEECVYVLKKIFGNASER